MMCFAAAAILSQRSEICSQHDAITDCVYTKQQALCSHVRAAWESHRQPAVVTAQGDSTSEAVCLGKGAR